MSKRARRKASQRRPAQRAHAPPDDRATDARSPSHLAKRGFQGLVAVVGLLIALTQLVDWLESRGKPVLSAEFAALQLSEIQLRREFLSQANRVPEPDETETELDQRGLGMEMRIRSRADPERTLLVRWAVYDAATGRPIPGPRWRRIVARLRARQDEQESTVPCFIPLPEVAHFFVLLTVETVEGRVVTDTRTEPVSTAAPD
jgi:hypothetical protein